MSKSAKKIKRKLFSDVEPQGSQPAIQKKRKNNDETVLPGSTSHQVQKG